MARADVHFLEAIAGSNCLQRYFQFESNFPVAVIVNDVVDIKQAIERIENTNRREAF